MRHQIRLLCVCVGAAVMYACSTPYQEMGLLGGVSATQIDANTMRISARGNGFSDIGRMKDYVLLKAAEETAAHGFTLFYVFNSENVTRTDTFTTTQNHIAPVMGTAMTPYGPVPAFGTAQYQTESTQRITKPGEDITIKMMSGAKPDNAPANLYSAVEIMTFLGPSIMGDHYAPPALMPPAATPVVTAAQPNADTPPPMPACTDSDRQLAELAKRNGYQYAGACQ